MTWSPPKPQPWPLEQQIVAMGCDPPTVTKDSWHLLRERLIVHLCATAKCRECAESRRLWLRTMRVTREAIADGTALDRIGALTWTGAFELSA